MHLDLVWEAILSLATLALGWLHHNGRKEIDAMKTATVAAQKAIDDHKLYAAEKFARREEVNSAVEAIEERLMEALEKTEGRLTKALDDAVTRLDEIRDRLPPKT